MIKQILKPIVVCDFCEERETDYKCHVCNKSLCNECSTTIHPRLALHVKSLFSPTLNAEGGLFVQKLYNNNFSNVEKFPNLIISLVVYSLSYSLLYRVFVGGFER